MPALTATLHKFREYTTYAVAVFFLLPILWTSYLIAFWALSCVIIIFLEFKQIKKTDLKNAIFYLTPFLLFILSIQFHGGGGGSILERQMSFIVFPCCIFLSCYKISKKELKRLIIAFLIGCGLLAIKGPLMYLFVGLHFPYSAQHDFMYKYRTEFYANTQISPTHACLYFGFAIILLTLQMKEFVKQKWVTYVILGFLLFNMILLSAKMPIIATGIILVILLIRKQIIWRTGSRKKLIIGASLLLMVGVGMLFFTRWGELITRLKPDLLGNKESSVDVRTAITQCDIELTKEYFLLGTGPQHLQKKLDQCYYQFEGNVFSRNTFNTHNQYFDYLLSHGIIGLFLLLVIMIVPLYKAIRAGDPILMSFIILIMLCMLTENILSRQGGIVFYALWNALLLNRKVDKIT